MVDHLGAIEAGTRQTSGVLHISHVVIRGNFPVEELPPLPPRTQLCSHTRLHNIVSAPRPPLNSRESSPERLFPESFTPGEVGW